jgi:hypothetical protein
MRRGAKFQTGANRNTAHAAPQSGVTVGRINPDWLQVRIVRGNQTRVFNVRDREAESLAAQITRILQAEKPGRHAEVPDVLKGVT